MRKQLTTVQQNKRNRIIKRIVYVIILAITIPCAYLYCSNYVEDYFKELNSYSSISSNKSSEKKNIVKKSDIIDTKETSTENIDDTQNTISSTNKYTNKDITDNTSTEAETANNNTDSNKFSDYKPTLPTDNADSSNNLDTEKDFSTNININSEADKQINTEISSDTSAEINQNNEQINQYKKQTEKLNAIKEKYDAKVSAIETWYNNEFNKNYDLMIENKNKYEELGGYAATEDKTVALKKLQSADAKMANAGLANTGYAASYKKALQEEYELVCERWSYSQKYDEYYEYIYTTLPAEKTSKLSVVTEEYNEDLKNYKEKYGL